MAEADIRFVLAGERYEIFVDDFTGTEHKLFRDAIGMPLSGVGGQIGFDGCLALVWLLRRRSAKNKGLPFAAVADAYTGRDLAPWPEDEQAEDEKPEEGVSPEA